MNIPSERKAQLIIRLVGGLVGLFGVVLSLGVVPLGHGVTSSIGKGEWLEATLGLIYCAIPAGCAFFFIHTGWRAARQPESADIRSTVAFGFTILYFLVLACLGLIMGWILDLAPDLKHARWFDVGSEIFLWGPLPFCIAAYYATCRWLRWHGAFNETQRAALAAPPSKQFLALLVFSLFTHPFSLIASVSEDLPAFNGLGLVMLFAMVIGYYWLKGALARYLAAPAPVRLPDPSLPPPVG